MRIRKCLPQLILLLTIMLILSSCAPQVPAEEQELNIKDYAVVVQDFGQRLSDSGYIYSTSELDVKNTDCLYGMKFFIDDVGTVKLYSLDINSPEFENITNYKKMIDEAGKEIFVRLNGNIAFRIDSIPKETDVQDIMRLYGKAV